MEEERWLNGSAPDCKSVVLGSNPAPPQHMAKLCYSLGGLPPRMAQYCVLASEGRQSFSVYTKKT